MVEEVLRIVGHQGTYSIVNMPSRIKMIVDKPPKMTKQTLTTLHDAGYRMRADVKENQLHVEIPKSKRKRKRAQEVTKYRGKLDKCYMIGEGEEVLRYLLGVPDMCDFEVHVDVIGKEKHIHCKNVECVEYAVIAEACHSAGVVCDFPNTQWTFMLHSV